MLKSSNTLTKVLFNSSLSSAAFLRAIRYLMRGVFARAYHRHRPYILLCLCGHSWHQRREIRFMIKDQSTYIRTKFLTHLASTNATGFCCRPYRFLNPQPSILIHLRIFFFPFLVFLRGHFIHFI